MDYKTLDVKDKILFIESDGMDRKDVEQAQKFVASQGGLGVVVVPVGTEVSVLGLTELENIVEHIKKARRDNNVG